MYFCCNTWDDTGMKKKTLVEDMTNIIHQDVCRIELCKQYDRSLDRFVMTTRGDHASQKVVSNPIYKPWKGHLEGEQPQYGDLLTKDHGY